MATFHGRRHTAALICTSLILTLAACGGDDDDAADAPPTADDTGTAEPTADDGMTAETADDTATTADGTGDTATDEDTATGADDTSGAASGVAGCGEGSFTDLTALGEDLERTARCEPGAPAPVPLDEPATVTVSISSLSSELALPLLLAQQHGEFEKENLTVEIETLSPTDALPLLAQDDVDLMISSAGAALYNAVAAGFDVRWTIPVNYGPPEQLDGLWARGADVQLADVADMKVASAVGLGSPVSHNMHVELQKVGISWADLDFEVLPVSDIGEALRNGAVDAAVLISPFWIPFVDDPEYTHLITNTPAGEPLAAVLAAPNLVGERHDVGVAFHRAWIRTINTYLAGPDYKADAEFCAEVAELLGQETEAFCAVPGAVYDYEVKAGTTDRMQETYFELDVLEYDEALPESQLVDRSFVEEAIGHTYDVG